MIEQSEIKFFENKEYFISYGKNTDLKIRSGKKR